MDIGKLLVAVDVPSVEPSDTPLDEVTIEMSLDNEIVLVLAFPHDGHRVDRDEVAKLFAVAGAAIPTILDQMEAPNG